MSSSINLQTAFLSQSTFAIAGASKDPRKFGYKILKWYTSHGFSVVPINPKETEIDGIVTISDIEQLKDPKMTSLSVVTPPKVTLDLLVKAFKLGIPYVWIQPGAEDEKVIDWVNENAKDKVLYGGVCVLVDGERRMREREPKL